MRKHIFAGVLLLLICFATETSRAAEPYDNIAMPQGSYFSAYPLYYGAGRLKDKDGDALSVDPNAALYQTTFKYNYYDRTLLPNTSVISAFIPAGCMELLGDRDCGIGDLSLVVGYWFVDDPAARTWFGTRLQTVAPIGSYDRDRKANMGGNVWKFRPQLYAAKQVGDLLIELTAKYMIYTKNKETDTRPGNEVNLESYAGYFLRSDLLLGGHLNGTFGRARTVAGSRVPDSGVRIFQAGPSLLKNFGKGFSVTVEGLADFAVKNSTEGYTVLVRLSWKR